MKQTNESAFVEAEKKRLSRRSNCRPDKRRKSGKYPPEFRLRAAKMCVEEGRSQAEVARLLDISMNTLSNWALNYRRGGGVNASVFRSSETPRSGSEERSRLPEPVREQIVWCHRTWRWLFQTRRLRGPRPWPTRPGNPQTPAAHPRHHPSAQHSATPQSRRRLSSPGLLPQPHHDLDAHPPPRNFRLDLRT